MERLEWAYRLHQSRGLTEWAEREYRFVIEKEPLIWATGLRAGSAWPENVHDRAPHDADAAAVCRPSCSEAMDRDPNVDARIGRSVL